MATIDIDFRASVSVVMPQRNTLKYSSTFLRSDGIDTCFSQLMLPSHCSMGVTVLCVLKMNAKRHFLVDPPSSQVHSY